MTAMDKIKAGEIIVALMEDWAQANMDQPCRHWFTPTRGGPVKKGVAIPGR